MKPVKDIISEYSVDISSMDDYCNEIYTTKFQKYFNDTESLYEALSNNLRPITDDELNTILTMCPLNMIEVTDALSECQRNLALIKLKSKELKLQRSEIPKDLKDTVISLETKLLENNILICAYESIIKRVEGKVSYTRELIMSAKKIWDARRHSLEASPIGPIGDEETIPVYNPDNMPKNYIK